LGVSTQMGKLTDHNSFCLFQGIFLSPFSQHWHLLTSPRRVSSSSLIISAPVHLIVAL
jgi:hypothetical protein